MTDYVRDLYIVFGFGALAALLVAAGNAVLRRAVARCRRGGYSPLLPGAVKNAPPPPQAPRGGTGRAYKAPTPFDRQDDEFLALLASAYMVASRKGADTNWEALEISLLACLHAHGRSGATPRTYMATAPTSHR